MLRAELTKQALILNSKLDFAAGCYKCKVKDAGQRELYITKGSFSSLSSITALAAFFSWADQA